MFATDNRVAVVSSAQTELRPAWSGLQHVDLISTAVTKALKGSGLRMEDVDFVIDAGSDILDGRSISNCGFLGAMGAHQKEESRVEEDGLWAAMYAATKIAAGPAEVGLVVAYSKPSESDLSKFYASQTEPFTQRPVGFGHEAACGLQAQAYLGGTDVTADQLAGIVAHDYANAAKNPGVQVVDAIDAAAVRASPNVAAPLRQLDLSRPVDGAVAMVLTSRAVAERITSTPVWITGIGTAMDLHSFAQRDPGTLAAAAAAAKACYAKAGITDPKRASIVETGAGSVVGQLMVLEALGLADPGKGAGLYDGGGGGPVLNPSGGSLPADPIMATGLVRLHEAALQLAGRVGHATEGAKSAIVHATGGVGMQNHCVFTLEV
jgi:acetyl-CoA C-acetyltransferase